MVATSQVQSQGYGPVATSQYNQVGFNQPVTAPAQYNQVAYNQPVRTTVQQDYYAPQQTYI